MARLPYYYGQQNYRSSPENPFSGFAPDEQIPFANTLLSTVFQGQVFGPNPGYRMYQQSQVYQGMDYRGNRGFLNETMQRGPRYVANTQVFGPNPGYGMYQQSQVHQGMDYRGNRGYLNETMQRGPRYVANTQGDRNGQRRERNDRRGAIRRSVYHNGMDREKVGRDQGHRNKAGQKDPKKPEKVVQKSGKTDVEANKGSGNDRAESSKEEIEEVKDVENKKSDEEEMEEDETDEKEEEANENKAEEDTTEYAGLPREFLYCHFCEKNLWNGPSFLRHTRSKKHKGLVRRLEGVYEATVKSLRLISQLNDFRRSGFENPKGRFGKRSRRFRRVRCDRCDITFYGSNKHRANQAHHTLKNFIEASCDLCNEDLGMKINYDKHRLSAGHIKKLVEKSGGTMERPDLIDEVLEECKFVPFEMRIEIEGMKSGTSPVPKDTDFNINVIGPYNVMNPVGQSAVSPLLTYFCRSCSINIKYDEKLKLAHMQSEEHISKSKNEERAEGKELPNETAEDMANMDLVDEVNEEKDAEELKKLGSEEKEVENEKQEEREIGEEKQQDKAEE